MTKEITETELVSLIVGRSTHGFSVLYDRYASIVFHVITRIVKDEPAAEEILEKTFVKIWGEIWEFDSKKEGLLSWIIGIARRLSIDHMQEKGNAPEQTGSASHEPVSRLAEQDIIYMEAVELIFLEGRTYAEAAGLLNISIETLKNRIRTALLLFRRQS